MLYGFSSDEMIGRDVSLLIPADGRGEWMQLVRRAQLGEVVAPHETVRVRKDGTPVEVQITVSPLYDEHDKIVGASSIARDITQRRRDEAAVRRALKMRDQFMAMLSHELRNPLAALLHASAVLSSDHRGSQHQELSRHALEVVTRQCKHMARLLDDLLDVSRMRQDGIELRKQRVDLRTTIDAAVERLRPLAEAHGVELHLELPPNEVIVFGDPDRLQQIEVNLLGNAIKYSPNNQQVRLSLTTADGQALLRVSDDGIGIANEMLDRIFEPFVRAVDEDNQVHAPQMGGMGLGLAVVRSFVRAHGGEVRALSEGAGRGSEFVVTLPLAMRADEDAAIDARGGGSERLVLVEDQDDSRVLLQAILEDAGYHVLTAGDGQSAVELIERHRPRIALVDIGLPVLNGYEVARRVRRAFGPNDLFLVALTGYGQQQDRDAVMSAGFDQHLVKPIEAEALVEVLRSRRCLRPGERGGDGTPDA
jgi:two-component system CheB/CheR fusion protein